MTASNNNLSRRGVTMLEVVITCVVVGILAAIAIPTWRGYNKWAQQKANLKDLQTLNEAIEILRWEQPNSTLFTSGNGLTQHQAILAALQASPNNPLKGLAVDATQLESSGSGSGFRFTEYESGAIAQAAPIEEGGSGGSGTETTISLDPNDFVLNARLVSGLTGGGASNLDGVATASLATGVKMIVGVGGTQYLYELAGGSDTANPPSVVRPMDFNAATNAKVWIARRHFDTLVASSNLGDLTNIPQAQQNIGMKTMALQDANNVAITGGSAAFAQNGLTVGDQIGTAGNGVSLAGRMTGSMVSLLTVVPRESTVGAGLTLAGPNRSFTLFSSGVGSALGAGYFSIYDTTSSSYRLVLAPNGNIGLGGVTNPSGTLTVLGNGVNDLLSLLNSSGTPVFQITKDGGMVLHGPFIQTGDLEVTGKITSTGAVTANGGVIDPTLLSTLFLSTNASGRLVDGTANADARFVNVSGDTMTGNLSTSGTLTAGGKVTGSGLAATGLTNATIVGTDASGNVISATATTDARYVNVTGDSMTGDLSTTGKVTAASMAVTGLPSAVVVGTDASGNVVSGTAGADGRWVNVSGDTMTGNLTAPTFTSNIATGTAPFTVTSTTLVTNLNSQYLNGQAAAYYLNAGNMNAGTLLPARLPAFTGGDVTSVAGTATLTLANSGVTAGTFTKVTVDAKGRVTTGANLASSDVTTALGYTPVNKAGDTMTGALIAPTFTSNIANGTAPFTVTSSTLVANLNSQYLNGQAAAFYQNAGNLNAGTLLAARLPAFTGDATSTAGTSTLTLANSGVSPGTFTKVTVDSKGRVTTGANLASGDVTTALGFTPVNKAGDTVTGQLLVRRDANQISAGRGSGTNVSLNLMGWTSNAFIAAGASYNGSAWVHDNSYSNNSSLLNFVDGAGMQWYASNNSSASWNVASGVTLWDQTGKWVAPIAATSITSALGYTPVNKAGDSMTGSLSVTGNVTASGTVQGGTVTSTGAVQGASVTATGAVQGASVTATGTVQGANVVATAIPNAAIVGTDATGKLIASTTAADGRYVLKSGDTVTGNLRVNGTTTLDSSIYVGNSWIYLGAGAALRNNGINALSLYDTAGTTIHSSFSLNGGNSYINASAGNVGVGTASPGVKLDVAGVIRANTTAIDVDNIGSGTALGTITDATGFSAQGIGFGPSSGNMAAIVAGSGNLYFGNQNGSANTLNVRMLINSAGNVGIGASSPTAKLDVAGNIAFGAASALIHRASGDLDTNGFAYTSWQDNSTGSYVERGWLGYGEGNANLGIHNGVGAVQLRTAAGAVLTATASGSVGIGTASPGGKLTVTAATGTAGLQIDSAANGATWFPYSDNKNYIRGTTIIADAGGSVGIGTTSPTEKLHVSGGRVLVTGSSYTTNPAGPIFGQYNATTGYVQAPSGGMFDIWNSATAAIARFYNDQSSRFYGTTYVGGDGSYANLIQTVNHGNYQSQILPASANGGGNGEAGLYLWVSEPGATWTGAGIGRNMRNNAGTFNRINSALSAQSIRFGEDGSFLFTTESTAGTRTYPLTVTSSGITVSGTVSAGSFNATSTRRFKENIMSMDPKTLLAKALRLRPVTYDWKKGYGKGGHDFGFIAEEVEAEFPEAVGHENGVVSGVDYSRLSVVAIGAVKELSNQVTALKQEQEDLVKRAQPSMSPVYIAYAIVGAFSVGIIAGALFVIAKNRRF